MHGFDFIGLSRFEVALNSLRYPSGQNKIELFNALNLEPSLVLFSAIVRQSPQLGQSSSW